jgi:MFS family permease
MGRTVAVIWHGSFSIAAGVLYFFFVLPRTPELLGDISPTLGTVLRIVVGALIGLAALPVVFTLLRTRRPEFGTPQMALNLRTASIALHVLAGVLIIGTAVTEIWVPLDSAGQWFFGIYGAAAALALLGVLAFYLAFAAELPPPPPKPLKAKARKERRGRRAGSDADATETDGETADTDTSDTEAEETETAEDEPAPTAEAASDSEDAPDTKDESDGKLRNRRPDGKTSVLGRRKRTRGGVAVED